MDIFENLESLNVSEECFDEIMGIVEELLNEKYGLKEVGQTLSVGIKHGGNIGDRTARMGQAMHDLGHGTKVADAGLALRDAGHKISNIISGKKPQKPTTAEQAIKDRNKFKQSYNPNKDKTAYTDNVENAWSKLVRDSAIKNQYRNS